MAAQSFEILNRFDLPQGGFAGLKEHQLVTDSRVFGARKRSQTSEGIGNFVYLADAQFMPHGETTMHPHHEIDVISVMVEGRISHEGSLEHGQGLEAGAAQVQRAGGEGFSHNEVNPDGDENRMIQLWVMPETSGEPAGYKVYQPHGPRTKIYGGNKDQEQTFDSHTHIDVSVLNQGDMIQQNGETLVYLTKGRLKVTNSSDTVEIGEGTLLRGKDVMISALEASQAIVIYEQ